MVSHLKAKKSGEWSWKNVCAVSK